MELALASPPSHYGRPGPADQDPGQTHVVQPGDTLHGIARQHGVPPSELIAANPQFANPDLIYPGDIVHVPVPQADGPGCSAPEPSCAVELAPLPVLQPFFPVGRVVHPALEPPMPAVRQPVESPDGPSGQAPGPVAALIERLVGFIDRIGLGPDRPVDAPSSSPDAVEGEPDAPGISPWIQQRGPLDDLDPETAARIVRDADGRVVGFDSPGAGPMRQFPTSA